MPSYRRRRKDGATVFLTVVAHERRALFESALARRLLHAAIVRARDSRPWEMTAMVLLPDHLHMLWQLPPGDDDYSSRASHMKGAFTRAWLARGGNEGSVKVGQVRHRRRGVWQERFWEHLIRGPEDLKMHLDYIHLNPVKHGLVEYPRDWPFSTFRRYVDLGEYPEDWLGRVDLPGNVEYFDHDE